MADFLSKIGFGSAPDPTKFNDQKEVNAQLGEVKSNIQSTLSSISLATKAASLIGLPAAVTDNLLGLEKEARSLSENLTLPPDQLEKKRAELDAKFQKAQKEQKDLEIAETEKGLTGALETIRTRVLQIKGEGTTSQALVTKFIALEDSAVKSLEAFRKGLAGVPTGPTGPTGPSSEEFIPLAPSELLAQLEILELEKTAEENKAFSWKRFSKRIWIEFKRYANIAFIILMSLIGGFWTYNHYASSYILLRAFYFVYGAAFFPVSTSYFAPIYMIPINIVYFILSSRMGPKLLEMVGL